MQRKTLEANDYYDEDDDLFLDRTGQLEKQREKRKQWAEEGYGHRRPEKDTYESLCAKLEAAKQEIIDCQKHLDALATTTKKPQSSGEAGGDVLDDYIRQLEKSGGTGDDAKTKMEKSKWRQKLVAATHESQKLEKLVKIAKPKSLGLSTGGGPASNKQAFLQKLMGVRARKQEVTSESETIPTTTAAVAQKNDAILKGAGRAEEIRFRREENGYSGSSNRKRKEEVVKQSSEKGEPPVKARKKGEPFGSKVQKRVAEWEEELEVSL
uniref:Uncharacterized protein n=1 Tax=Caenorhabditis japonica TaxID=281687 RepID=A0A8R1IK95_CAEJA